MLHSFKTRKIKSNMMAIKLGIQKAYDRVNWRLLKAALAQYGFSYIFISWILVHP